MNTAVRLAESMEHFAAERLRSASHKCGPHGGVESLALPTSRAGLSNWLRRQCAETGADFYMLVALGACATQGTRIAASNWSYDAVELVGHETLAHIAAAAVTRFCGERPALWDVLHGERAAQLQHDQIMALREAGHRQLVSARLHVGGDRYCVLFSAADMGAIRQDEVRTAVVRLSYALASVAGELAQPLAADPLTERERECLYWVAEGKTSEEVSTIVGVSVNTVTSYVMQAIRRLSASNRTMAVATAIRAGFI